MSYIKPKYRTIGAVTSPSSHTGDTNQTVLQTILIPANTFKEGDLMYFSFFSSSDNGQVFNNRVYINTTPDLTGTPIQLMYYSQSGSRRNKIYRYFAVQDANTMKSFQNVIANTSSLSGSYSGPYSATAGLDFTVDQYLVYSIQMGNSAATLTNWGIFLKRLRQE